MRETRTVRTLQRQVASLAEEAGRGRRWQAIVTVLHAIAEAVSTTTSMQDLFATIHRALAPVIDTENFFIALYHPGNDSLSFPYFVDKVDSCYPVALNVSNTASLSAWVIREQRPMLLRRAEISLFRESCGLTVPPCTPSEIWLGAPLKTPRGAVGVMAVQSYDDPLRYDENHLQVLAAVADMAAIAIERKRVDDALRESEENFRRIVTTVGEGIVQLDGDHRIAFANRSFAAMLGYRVEEVVGRPFASFFFPEDVEDFNRRQDQRQQGRDERFERRFRTREGKAVWAIVSASPLVGGDGSVRGSYGAITDITERKEAETRLREANGQLRRAMEQVKTLRGIVPICMHCKKIRDDKGYWNQVEVYVRNHTEAEFSHGLCPDCLSRFYPGVEDE